MPAPEMNGAWGKPTAIGKSRKEGVTVVSGAT